MSKKERKPLVFLTQDQKIEVMRDYDLSGMMATKVCKKWGISQSALYKIKKSYWGIYESTKESMNNRDKITTINAVKVDTNRKMALIEKKAGDVIGRVLNMIEHKLDIEEMRMRGEVPTSESGEAIQLRREDIVTVQDLTKFFQVAAPYFLKVQDAETDQNTNMARKHSFITHIMNQQIIQNNGNKENTNTGITA